VLPKTLKAQQAPVEQPVTNPNPQALKRIGLTFGFSAKPVIKPGLNPTGFWAPIGNLAQLAS
jgi:hypothetical protein